MRTTANDPSRNDFLLDFVYDAEEEVETSVFEPIDMRTEARRAHLAAQARLTAEAHAMLGIAPGSEPASLSADGSEPLDPASFAGAPAFTEDPFAADPFAADPFASGPISEVVEVTDADVVELDVHALLTKRTDSFLDELAPEARAVLLQAREPVAAWPDAPRVFGAIAKPLPSV